MPTPSPRPYNLQVWRVNVRTQSLQWESVPASWEHLGGRGLVARFLLDEVPAACEPMGPYNKLIFAPGLLVGHMLSSCDRISIGGKSSTHWRGQGSQCRRHDRAANGQSGHEGAHS